MLSSGLQVCRGKPLKFSNYRPWGQRQRLDPGGVYLLGRSGLHTGTPRTFPLIFFLVALHTFFFFFYLCYSAFHPDGNRINSWERRRSGEVGVNQCFVMCKMGRRVPVPGTVIIHC